MIKNNWVLLFLILTIAGPFLIHGVEISDEYKQYRKKKFQHVHHTYRSGTAAMAEDLSSSGSDPCSLMNITQYYFTEAVIDNFSPIETQQTWHGNGQRYWVNTINWGGPGFPVFVYIGGEGEESCETLTDWSLMYKLSIEHSSLMVNVEHRFYGESYPTADMSTSNLTYLSSSQALADLARLVTYVKTQYNTEDSEVITFGGSYPGNLAAWFRLKYPSITLGSVASSAPLTAQTNFSEYMDVVGQAMVYFGGIDCYNNFQSAAQTVATYGAQGLEGWNTLSEGFKTCAPISSALDYATFLSDIMGNIQGTVQYNDESSSAMNITDICAIMDLNPISPYFQFLQLNEAYLEYYNVSCWDVSWENLTAYISDPAYDPTNSYRPWTYQTCNEFGYFQTTDSPNQPFNTWAPLTVAYNEAICNQCFNGWDRLPEVDWINIMNGDVNISGTNIAFPAGTIDPWHALGVTNATKAYLPEESETAVYILGTAHCADMYAPSPSDPPPLAFAKVQISNLVATWLADAAPPTTETTCSCPQDYSHFVVLTIVASAVAVIFLLTSVVLGYMLFKAKKTASGMSESLIP